MFDFIEWKEKDNLIPIQVPDKEKYYHDLSNIEQSWTGRVDAMLANTFIQEAVQLVMNAIVLFEKGYFDCAFYSLRQSLEVSTTMVYLTELTPERRDVELKKWQSQSDFPMYGQMMGFLNDKGEVFADIKDKMSDYFEHLRQVQRSLNKQVHKQGFNTFYVSRNHLLNKNRDEANFLYTFESYIKNCVGAIAVLRLTIDPFPVLLMDEEIYTRTGDLMTEPFTAEFVGEYIGTDAIEQYKRTFLYSGYYDQIMTVEQMLPCVTDIVKFQYVDKTKYEDILTQAHLLTRRDLLAVCLAISSTKIAKIYFEDGWIYYHTSTPSARQSGGYDTRVFRQIKEVEKPVNVDYDEAFLTHVTLLDEAFYIEHNSSFEEHELESILNTVTICVGTSTCYESERHQRNSE